MRDAIGTAQNPLRSHREGFHWWGGWETALHASILRSSARQQSQRGAQAAFVPLALVLAALRTGPKKYQGLKQKILVAAAAMWQQCNKS